MSKGVILGGTVAYEDGIKTTEGDQFSPTRKVRVELNFAVPDDPGIDEDDVIGNVLDTAHRFVNGKLGLKVPTPAAKTVVVKTKTDLATEATAKAEAAPAAQAAPAKRGPKPKAKPEAVLATQAPAANPAAVVDEDETVVDQAATAENPAAVTEEENWDAPAPEITDKALNDAVSKKNAKLANPPAIRALVGQFNPKPGTPFNLRQIAQDQRQTFLDKLEAL